VVGVRVTDVVLATCAALPGGVDEDAGLLDALAAEGLRARWQVWGEPVDADLVVLRSTWDYTWRLLAFLDWCAGLGRLANPLRVVIWNTDKAYLLELAESGVPVVPTELVAPGERASWPDGEFVIKPSIGAGARGFGRFTDPDAAAAHLTALHAVGRTAMVQPFQRSVAREGEFALVYLGGRYSHAFAKSEPGAEPVDDTGLRLSARAPLPEPGPALRTVAEDVMDAAAAVLGMPRAALLYARVDLVRGEDGAPLLLELELVEPNLAFSCADPGAPRRFARAVRSSLG
jgi:glutathione synthase/RimK-type ligase-like ATP-grasp enzyme